MFKRQKSGSVLCPSCGKLVGVHDAECYNCGRRNPGMWGFASVLRGLGNNFGFDTIVIWSCAALYLLTLLFDPQGIRMSEVMKDLILKTLDIVGGNQVQAAKVLGLTRSKLRYRMEQLGIRPEQRTYRTSV